MSAWPQPSVTRFPSQALAAGARSATTPQYTRPGPAGQKKGGAARSPSLVAMAARSETEHRHEGAGLIEALPAHPDAAADHDRDVLLAADAVGHRRSRDRGTQVEAVEFLKGGGVIGGEFPRHM